MQFHGSVDFAVEIPAVLPGTRSLQARLMDFVQLLSVVGVANPGLRSFGRWPGLRSGPLPHAAGQGVVSGLKLYVP
eukprot:8637384-Lingulodinium_polyedra.AAC.1